MKKKLSLFIIWVLLGFVIEVLANPQGTMYTGLGHLFINYILLLSLFPFGAGLILFYGETKKGRTYSLFDFNHNFTLISERIHDYLLLYS